MLRTTLNNGILQSCNCPTSSSRCSSHCTVQRCSNACLLCTRATCLEQPALTNAAQCKSWQERATAQHTYLARSVHTNQPPFQEGAHTQHRETVKRPSFCCKAGAMWMCTSKKDSGKRETLMQDGHNNNQAVIKPWLAS